MTDSIHKATHEGELKIGNLAMPCAVLEDGTRVLSERGVTKALGAKRSGSHWKRMRESGDGAFLPVYLSAANLKPFVDAELSMALSHPIKFRGRRGGNPGNGVPATILPKICDTWLKARDAGVLTPQQEHIAAQADLLMRGLAHVGVIALVDEATGYQEVRAKDELNKILERYISKELLPWAKRFPDEFYKQLFRLHGWPYDPGSVKRPSVVGHMTNELIYQKLPPGILDELKRRNPKNERGNRIHRHHQFLTDDIGEPHLEKQLAVVTSLMRASANKPEFMRLFRRAFPEKYPQQELPLPDSGDTSGEQEE